VPNALPRRKFLAIFAAFPLLMTGCSNYSGFGDSASPVAQAVAPAGEAIGTGTNKIALILPLSGPGNSGATALSMKQGAELALSEAQAQDTQILVKDDMGTPQGAEVATQTAINEGAQIVLGPLFAPSVSMAGQTARSAGIPIIAFSSDENVASPGVYLLSFLPSADVGHIVEFASSKGRKSYVALLPDDAYGTVAEAEFRTSVTRVGGRLVGLERYTDKASAQAAVARLAPALKQADALFIPDGPDGVGLVLDALKEANIPTANLKLLGTGRWDDARLHRNPLAKGGWYAAPDGAGFAAFAARYKAKYGSEPVRQASLAYDATLLAVALIKQMPPGQRFSQATLTNTGGFSGVDGIFRFLPSGANQRGIAVMEIKNGSVAAISPAPKTFGAGT
jgi:ABC-type branched-subunit amino acid transport system substrate-binding protein